MKKVLTVLSVIVLVACALFLFGCKDYKIKKNWDIDAGDDGYTIVVYGDNKLASKKGNLVIPGIYKGKPIVTVRGYLDEFACSSLVFSEGIQVVNISGINKKVTKVSFPNSLIYATPIVFQSSYITNYTVKNGVKYLGNEKNPYVYAAGLADKTVTDVVLEEGCTAIGSFGGTSIQSITLPDGVQIIPENAFKNCKKLTTVNFGTQTKIIDSEAFLNCESLTSINLDGVEKIYDRAFKGCSSLTEVEVPYTVTEMGEGVFSYCSSLTVARFNASVKTLPKQTFYFDNLKDLVIGNAVLEIGKDVLRGSSSTLETLKLSDAMTILPTNAFSGYSALKEVNLPASLTAIPYGCFSGCSALAEITLPSKIETIGEEAFFGCTSLTSIKIPSRVTHIPARAFFECTSLSSVTFTKNVTSIGEQAFWRCEAFRSIVLPDSIQAVGAEAFGMCLNLTKIVLPASVTELSYRVFIGCEGLTVYCKASKEGASWHPDWNTEGVPVEFNYRSN